MLRLISLMLLISLPVLLASQEAGSTLIASENQKRVEPEIKIFPVPVLNGHFTITSDIAFTSVRMTNIIGQEIIRERFSYPRNRAEINFATAEKGIYLLTIEMEDKTRIVRKILVDTGR
ncbi:MAG: T9SS type A sorting domain-containing protein [Bacteroidales bacterium]|nr:T9SS type A sorting domain-containing protein [Bacteroidales bacterium]